MQTPGSQPVKKRSIKRESIFRSLFLLAIGLRRHYRVVGNSMEPAIEAGDIVIYRPIKTGQLRLEKGCIVIAKHPLKIKTSIIKRVIRATSLGVELRGDNEGSSTDSRHFGVINSQDILGIVEEIIPINF